MVDPKILKLIDDVEVEAMATRNQADRLFNTAAVLRQKLLAGGRPAASRKGQRPIDPDIAALASSRYQRKQLKKIIK